MVECKKRTLNLPGVYLFYSYFYYFLIKKNSIEIQIFLLFTVFLAETDAATVDF